MASHIERFAKFAVDTSERSVPPEVRQEAKRILLDSIGCALAAIDTPAGRIGIDYARVLGGTVEEATILGGGEGCSVHGAAFANAELINALDMDTVAAPGHVSPYVVPVVLAIAEALNRSGPQVIAAIAVSHEMCFRFARAMDQNRDIANGRAQTSPVLGYSSVVFGTTAAAAMLKAMSSEQVADALGIAGSTTPVNAHRAWLQHAPASTIKNHLSPGGMTLTSLTAAYLAEAGHRGDRQLLDDTDYGYRRYIGTTRWDPSHLTTALGEEWRFTAASFFKPYPHCRVPHALFDALIDLIKSHDLAPNEIETLTAYGEEWGGQFPTFMNRTIERPFDAQFSFPHGLALAAHLIEPGKAWQDPETVYDPSVLALMSRVVWRSHPDWAAAVSADPAARPSRIEIVARNTTFVNERNYPKGTPSPEPATYMTDDEVVAKFLHNAAGVVAADDAHWVADQVMHLEKVRDFGAVMRRVRLSAAMAER